jgi:predicted AlkP superfamily phosphohydrolase/phosphomutase
MAGVFIAGLAALGCQGRPVAGKQLIVLGIDGMDYRVVRDLISQGRMPNFSRLAASGGFTPLASTVPPQSPVAWSSVITGLDPSSHGIFDFIHRDPATLAPYLSTTRSEAPRRTLTIGSWRLPLSGGRVELLRDGQPFWDVLETRGIRTNIMRMPANFPPSGSATRELSGMGTPDLLGTYGTFSFFTSPSGSFAGQALSGGRLEMVNAHEGVVRGQLTGPDNPFRTPARPVTLPFDVYIDARAKAAKLAVGDEERVLKVGEWSDWVPVEFPLASFQSLPAMARFYLKQIEPAFELYVSPLNLDPASPAMPISTPASYAPELARDTGRFHTQGIAEETKALSEHVLSRDEFLAQARAVGDENIRQYWHVLDRFEDEVLFYYFGNLDQVSHMMWRPRDPMHPAYDSVADAPYRQVVDDLYVAFDQIVGETLRRTAGRDVTLVVMSDHGFTSWRRSFNLNSWLRDRGYLKALDLSLTTESDFANIDWSATRAYGLGLNGLYLNLQGRERDGIVAAGDRDKLIEEISRALTATIDPATGRAAVSRVYVPPPGSSGMSHTDRAPDLIVLYAEGTRGSNESALGGLPPEVFVDNTGEWSGDHCMDPDVVPGILLASRPLRRKIAALNDVPRAILAEFGIEGFPDVQSKTRRAR